MTCCFLSVPDAGSWMFPLLRELDANEVLHCHNLEACRHRSPLFLNYMPKRCIQVLTTNFKLEYQLDNQTNLWDYGFPSNVQAMTLLDTGAQGHQVFRTNRETPINPFHVRTKMHSDIVFH